MCCANIPRSQKTLDFEEFFADEKKEKAAGSARLCRLVMMLVVLGVGNVEQDTDIGHPAHIGPED